MVKKVSRLGGEVYSRVVEVLERMGGKALESNLLEELKKRDINLTPTELRQLLMKLEIHDKVRVLSLDEERKLVELVAARRG